jgi:hypothetical protein
VVLYDLEECECPSGTEYGREKGNIGSADAVPRIPIPLVVAYVWLPSGVFKARSDGVIVLDPKAETTSVDLNSNDDRCFRSKLVVDCWSGCSFCTWVLSHMTEDGDGEVSLVQSDKSECPRP